MTYQLMTMEQTNNLDFMPKDGHDTWIPIGNFDTFIGAQEAADDYVKSFKPVAWLELNRHLELGCCTPIHHPHSDAIRQWFKIYGVKYD